MHKIASALSKENEKGIFKITQFWFAEYVVA